MESFNIFSIFIVNWHASHAHSESLMIIYIRLFKMFYRYLGREPNPGYKERLSKIKGSIESLPTAESSTPAPVTTPALAKTIVDNVIKEEPSQPSCGPFVSIKPSTVPTTQRKPEAPSKNPTMPEIKISCPSPAGKEVQNEPKPVQRPGTLPLLGTTLTNRRGSVYLQIAAVLSSPDDASVSSDDLESDEEETPKKSKTISSRRKSFMAWITEKKKVFPALKQAGKTSEAEIRRQSFFSWVESREREKERARQLALEEVDEFDDFSENLDTKIQPRVSSLKRSESLNINPFKAKARQLMTSFRFIRKEPLDVRLKKFYAKLEEVKRRDAMALRVLSRNGCRSVQDIRSPHV